MKFLVFICVAGTMILSCNKNDFVAGTSGEGSAYLNDSLFTGRVRIYTKNTFCISPDTCIDIQIAYKNSSGFLRDEIFFLSIPLKLGKYEILYEPVGATLAANYKLIYTKYYADGDVSGPAYMISEPDVNNWIELKKFNNKTGYIEGSFKAKVVERISGNQAKDTIYITDGKFYGNIIWGL